MASLFQEQAQTLLQSAKVPLGVLSAGLSKALALLSDGFEWLLEVTNDETTFLRIVVGIIVSIMTMMVAKTVMAKRPQPLQKQRVWFAITEEELQKYVSFKISTCEVSRRAAPC